MEATKRVTKEQKLFLVQYLEEHRDFAHDRFINDTGAKSLREQWEQLALQLNSNGGSVKDGDGWKKAWINMRSKAKQKPQELRCVLEQSGVNANIAGKQLTHLDERIIGVMTAVAVVGQTNVYEPLRSAGEVEYVDVFKPTTVIEENEIQQASPVVATDSTRSENFRRRAPKWKHSSWSKHNKCS